MANILIDRENWSAFQSNGWIADFFNLDQNELTGRLTGDAFAHHPEVSETHNGRIDADRSQVSGGSVVIRVEWDNAVGIYEGNLNSQGSLSGFTFAEGDPAHQATWVSDKTFQ